MSRLPLHVFTIVLDGMPWLPAIFVELNRLIDVPWQWTIVEGAAMNVKDTAWCTAQNPRYSSDGTTEFLNALGYHPRIVVLRKPRWEGKVEQCNAALETFKGPGVLLQVDADEIWAADQLRTIVNCFEDVPRLNLMRFRCRYFVGTNLITDLNEPQNQWLRAWRFAPGDTFSTHEPPVMAGNKGPGMTVQETASLGLIFDHYSYATAAQSEFKARFYGKKYEGALQGWLKLQRHERLPAKIKTFFPWSAESTTVDRVFHARTKTQG